MLSNIKDLVEALHCPYVSGKKKHKITQKLSQLKGCFIAHDCEIFNIH